MDKQSTIEPRNPKGMRDFLPTEKRVRDAVLDVMTEVFQSYGFEPLETPDVELKEVLTGKIGTEEKLIYSVASLGDTEMALRYDLTVPLARVVAQYPELPKPFKRYQIGNSYRGENTQKGRYRQFLQVDIDTVGSSSPLSDGEIIACALQTFKKLGLKVTALINSRPLLTQKITEAGITSDKTVSVISSIDKITKIGKAGVIAELLSKGLSVPQAEKVLDLIKQAKPTAELIKIMDFLTEAGFKERADYRFDPYLSRGLDYYTGTIFEIDAEGYESGAVGGGGRYDNLVGSFTKTSLPAVGFSFGFDRTLEALENGGQLPKDKSGAKVLVTVFDENLAKDSFKIAGQLREAVPTLLYLGNGNLEKQLKYADQKGIPFAAVIGPKEAATNQITIKNLATTEQKTVSLDEAVQIIR